MKQFLKIAAACTVLQLCLIASVQAIDTIEARKERPGCGHHHSKTQKVAQFASFFARGAQTIAVNGSILFDTQTALQGITYNSSTGVFTVTEEGTYTIAAATPGYDGFINNPISIVVNGNAIAAIQSLIAGVPFLGATTAFSLPLTAGSTISLENTSGSSLSLGAATSPRYNAYITIQRAE